MKDMSFWPEKAPSAPQPSNALQGRRHNLTPSSKDPSTCVGSVLSTKTRWPPRRSHKYPGPTRPGRFIEKKYSSCVDRKGQHGGICWAPVSGRRSTGNEEIKDQLTQWKEAGFREEGKNKGTERLLRMGVGGEDGKG